MSLTLPPKPTIKRLFPHLDDVPEYATQATLRLLWDRTHDMEERLQQAQAANAALIAAHNANETAITAAHSDARAALALSQTPGAPATSTGGGAPPPSGPPAGESGSQTNPIIAMSIVASAIAASVRASLQFYGIGYNPSVDQYWIDHASVPSQFSNGKWYQGWNAYWEARANPSNTGSADPNLGSQPAVHQ